MTANRNQPNAGNSSDLARYSRQSRFTPLGERGQRKLLASRVTLIGCGALGTNLANALVRAGVGFLRIVDRDAIELSNLQRQMIFDESDIAAGLPKAEAARRKLQRINSRITIEAAVTNAGADNIADLADRADLLLDGTDNFETRFLINDMAVKTRLPWVFGACAGATGLVLPVIPGQTPCLRCVFDEGPPPELNPTAETLGILGPVVSLVASYQAMHAIKILAGRTDALDRRLLSFNAWTGRIRQIDVARAYTENDCRCCKAGQFEYLESRSASGPAVWCGKDAVQVTPKTARKLDFSSLANRILAIVGRKPKFNEFLLEADITPYRLTVFPDARAIIKGTTQLEEALGVYARYVEFGADK